MTRGPADPQRLPTLTDVIEYDGEAMTVRSIAQSNGSVFQEAGAPAPAVEAHANGSQTTSTAALEPAPPQANAISPQTLELLLHQYGETLELQLRAALTPVLERIVQQAVETARRSLADAIAEIDPRLAGVAASVSTPQRDSAPPDAVDGLRINDALR